MKLKILSLCFIIVGRILFAQSLGLNFKNISGSAVQKISLGSNHEVESSSFFNSFSLDISLWRPDMQGELVDLNEVICLQNMNLDNHIGMKLSIEYLQFKHLFASLDLNICNTKALIPDIDPNLLPLSPFFTSTGSIGYKKDKGINFILSYRFLHSPDSKSCAGNTKEYLLTEAVLNYQFKRVSCGLHAENIFNKKWEQAQFDIEHHQKNEAYSNPKLQYVEGSPLQLKGMISFSF